MEVGVDGEYHIICYFYSSVSDNDLPRESQAKMLLLHYPNGGKRRENQASPGIKQEHNYYENTVKTTSYLSVFNVCPVLTLKNRVVCGQTLMM